MVIWEKDNSPNLPYVWKVIPQLNGECKRKSSDTKNFPRRSIGKDSDLVPDGVDDLGTAFYFRDDIALADGRERR